MQETCNLPFELTSESVNQWLKTIEEKTHSEKVNLVNGILNDLLKLETQALDLLTVLEPLTPLIMTLTKLLEANSVSEK